MALAIWGNAPTTPAVTMPRKAGDWRGAATKAFWRETKAKRQRATTDSVRERIAIALGQIIVAISLQVLGTESWAKNETGSSSNDGRTPYSGSNVKIVPMCCSPWRAT